MLRRPLHAISLTNTCIRTDLPTIMSSISLAFFLNCLQISMVNMVELLLNMEVREDISADIITASIKPEKIWEVIEVFNNIFEMGD